MSDLIQDLAALPAPATMQTPTFQQQDDPILAELHQDARDVFETFTRTHGIGYDITIPILIGREAVVPGYLMGLLYHLIAEEFHVRPPIGALDPVNPYFIQQDLIVNFQLVVAQEIIVASIYEFLWFPVDLQQAWRTVNFEFPSYFDIPAVWRVIQTQVAGYQLDPEDARREDVRRRLLRSNSDINTRLSSQDDTMQQASSASAQQPVVRDDDDDHHLDVQFEQYVNLDGDQEGGQDGHQGDNVQPPPAATAAEEDNPHGYSRREGGRLRSSVQRVNLAALGLLRQARPRRNAGTISPRSASPSRNGSPPVRQRSPLRAPSPFPFPSPAPSSFRNNVRNSVAAITRRLINTTVRNTNGEDPSPWAPAPQPFVTPSQISLLDLNESLTDHDRAIEDILYDTAQELHYQDPTRVASPINSFDTDPWQAGQQQAQRDHPLFTDSTGHPFEWPGPLLLSGGQTLGSTFIPGGTIPSSSRGGRAATNTDVNQTPVAHSSSVFSPLDISHSPPPQSSEQQPQPQHQPQPQLQPQPSHQGINSLVRTASDAPSTRNTRNSPASTLFSAPTTRTLHAVGPLANATPAEVAQFIATWQPDESIPQNFPGHVWPCPQQTCHFGPYWSKRDLTRHLRNAHRMPHDLINAILGMPVPARRVGRSWIFLDEHGNDLPQQQQQQDDSDDKEQH